MYISFIFNCCHYDFKVLSLPSYQSRHWHPADWTDGALMQNTVQKVITMEYIKFRVLFPAFLAGHTSTSKADNYSVTCETEHLLVRGLNAACAWSPVSKLMPFALFLKAEFPCFRHPTQDRDNLLVKPALASSMLIPEFNNVYDIVTPTYSWAYGYDAQTYKCSYEARYYCSLSHTLFKWIY